MDKPLNKSSDLRFIGLDFGNSVSRLAKTAYNSASDEFQEPEIRMFENDSCFPSFVVTKLGQEQTLTKRRHLQKIAMELNEIQAFERDCICRFERDPTNASANQCMKVIADRLFRETQSWLRFTDFEPDRYLVTIGTPSDWDLQSTATQSLKTLMNQAGFAAIQLVPEAVAAVQFHLHSSKYPLSYHKDQAQSWLVIDVGGKSTSFTCVEKPAGSSNLRVIDAFRKDWGGDHIDNLLYEDFLLPKHWHSIDRPNEMQKTILIQMTCELKERFSTQANRSRVAAINFQIEGVRDPVELSRDTFELLCQPLIQQFEELLEDLRLKTNRAFLGCEQVVLVGGGANWYFVQKAVNDFYPGKCIAAQEADQTIVKGLALARTGFEPAETLENKNIDAEKNSIKKEEERTVEVAEAPPLVITPRVNTNGRYGPGLSYPVVGHLKLGQQSTVYGRNEDSTWWCVQNPARPGEYFWVNAESTQVTGDISNIRILQAQPSNTDKKRTPPEVHKQAKQLIRWCAIVGTGIALLLSPIPGASWPFLMALEIFMFLRIAVSHYGYKITSGTVILLIAALLVISTILTIVVGEVIGTLAWVIGLGWLIKAAVAGIVIWGLGEGAIYILDKIAVSEQAQQ